MVHGDGHSQSTGVLDPASRKVAVNAPLPASPRSVGQLFREHAPFVWRVLRRMGVPESDVEDACQEVFLVVHRKLPGFEARSAVRTWIYGIAIRVAKDTRRNRNNQREELVDSVPEQTAPDDPHDALGIARARATLDRILDTLDDDKRAAFVLYELEELPMTEVACALGCPLQTAYSRLHAARDRVAKAVDRAQEHRTDGGRP